MSVPYIGAPTVWSAPTNLRGEGIKIAIIDTGIDYTHANFSGPGTVAAYAAADAHTSPANPSLLRPAGAEGEGRHRTSSVTTTTGHDPVLTPLSRIPTRSTATLAHGGHVAHRWNRRRRRRDPAEPLTPARTTPPSTPRARSESARALRRRRTSTRTASSAADGSTDLTVDAIDMAFNDGMDVINMSLGSVFGTADDASAEASNERREGGDDRRRLGREQRAEPVHHRVLRPPARVPSASQPTTPRRHSRGASMAISTDGSITAINANGATFANGTVLPVAVLRTSYPNGPVSLGCNPAEYTVTQAAWPASSS